jgi:hypothetical protein
MPAHPNGGDHTLLKFVKPPAFASQTYPAATLRTAPATKLGNRPQMPRLTTGVFFCLADLPHPPRKKRLMVAAGDYQPKHGMKHDHDHHRNHQLLRKLQPSR